MKIIAARINNQSFGFLNFESLEEYLRRLFGVTAVTQHQNDNSYTLRLADGNLLFVPTEEVELNFTPSELSKL